MVIFVVGPSCDNNLTLARGSPTAPSLAMQQSQERVEDVPPGDGVAEEGEKGAEEEEEPPTTGLLPPEDPRPAASDRGFRPTGSEPRAGAPRPIR